MVRLGQNFLADPNLLDVIVREAKVDRDDVVLEVGGGEGVLTRRLAASAGRVHVFELDQRLRGALEEVALAAGDRVELHWKDAVRADLAALRPAPTTMVSNLPYSIATPLLLRTIQELPGVASWTVLVQREIADRLRAAPGSRTYGAPSVLVQLACDVSLLRGVGRAVFRPRPRVDSALLRLERRGPGAGEQVVRVVRGAFAHRRKTAAASLELAGVAPRDRVRAALAELDRPPDARAELLRPDELARLAEAVR